MPPHNSSVFIVRASPRDEIADSYASHVAEGFVVFHPTFGPLHTSRFRNVISQFASIAEADTFLKSLSARTLDRFRDIQIEPASPELIVSFLTMEEERIAALQKLLPLADQVLEVFDFDRVHRAMAALNWKYTNDTESPAIEVLMSTARRLLIAAAEEDIDYTEHACGGFRAWRILDKLYLTFAIETAYAEPGRASRL